MIGEKLEGERLKLVEIERDLAAMRSRLERLDGLRESLLAEMAAIADSGSAAGNKDFRSCIHITGSGQVASTGSGRALSSNLGSRSL